MPTSGTPIENSRVDAHSPNQIRAIREAEPTMTLKSNCTPRASVFDRSRRDTVLDLSDFLENKIDGDRFFEEDRKAHV